jgi:hypothetical protein
MVCFTVAAAKDKKDKGRVLPDLIVNAHTAAVVIQPGTSEPITNPGLNRNAQEDVEQALARWGRIRPVVDPTTADLVIVIRKGSKGVGPTVRGGPLDQRPVILQPTDGNIRIGTQAGRPPLSQDPSDTWNRPQLGTGAQYSEDLFEVHMGNRPYPLDSPVLWEFVRKDALKAPKIPALEALRVAIEESEKQKNSKPATKP